MTGNNKSSIHIRVLACKLQIIGMLQASYYWHYTCIYIKHEYPETIKIDVHVYIYGVICEIIWGFLSQNEAIMHPKIAPKVWFHNRVPLHMQKIKQSDSNSVMLHCMGISWVSVTTYSGIKEKWKRGKKNHHHPPPTTHPPKKNQQLISNCWMWSPVENSKIHLHYVMLNQSNFIMDA